MNLHIRVVSRASRRLGRFVICGTGFGIGLVGMVGRGIERDLVEEGGATRRMVRIGMVTMVGASDSSAAGVLDLKGVLSEAALIGLSALRVVLSVVAHRQYRLIVLDRRKDRS